MPPDATLASLTDDSFARLLAGLQSSPSCQPDRFADLWRCMTAIDPVTRKETTLPASVGDERLMAFHFRRHTVRALASVVRDFQGDVVVRLNLVGIDGLHLGDVVTVPVQDESRYQSAWELLLGVGEY